MAPIVDGAQADIADVLPGVDLHVFASSDGVNLFLVLDAAPTTSTFTFVVDAPDLGMTARSADTFAYDQANRLTTATVAATTENYAYDGNGTRFSRQVGAGPITRYVSDVAGSLPTTIDDGTRKYVWGLGLAYTASGSSLEVFHTDRLGSVRAITDASGAVTATYRSDEFGVEVARTGSSEQPYTYTGEPQDATGLIYLRARYYDPGLGRFATADTWPGSAAHPQGINSFTYVESNPATYHDPSGRCIQAMALAVAGPPGAVAGGGITVVCAIVVGAGAIVGGLLVGAGIGQATAPLISSATRNQALDGPIPAPKLPLLMSRRIHNHHPRATLVVTGWAPSGVVDQLP